jgi:chromate transporter
VAAAAAGLVIAMAVKMAVPLLRRRFVQAVPFMLAAFVAVGLLRLPLVAVVLALAPFSVAASWRR